LRPHGVSDEAASAAIAWYRKNRYHGLKLFAETVEVLAALREAAPSRPIGLVTNGPAETQRAKIALLELEGLVDFAVVSGEFGVEKPDESIFIEALRQGGATAEATIFAGDSPAHDIAGAKGAGMFAVWVNRTGVTWTLGDPVPDATVSNLREFLGLVGAEGL
jgi:putative hydrolase of the HAD superfamily